VINGLYFSVTRYISIWAVLF